MSLSKVKKNKACWQCTVKMRNDTILALVRGLTSQNSILVLGWWMQRFPTRFTQYSCDKFQIYCTRRKEVLKSLETWEVLCPFLDSSPALCLIKAVEKSMHVCRCSPCNLSSCLSCPKHRDQTSPVPAEPWLCLSSTLHLAVNMLDDSNNTYRIQQYLIEDNQRLKMTSTMNSYETLRE